MLKIELNSHNFFCSTQFNFISFVTPLRINKEITVASWNCEKVMSDFQKLLEYDEVLELAVKKSQTFELRNVPKNLLFFHSKIFLKLILKFDRTEHYRLF